MSDIITLLYGTRPGRLSLRQTTEHTDHTLKEKARGATMADEENFSYVCAPWAPVLGFMGCASAIIFANLGGAYGTAMAGKGIMAMGVRSPELLMKNIIPVVMAGVLGIYGLIVCVILNGKMVKPESGTGFAGYSQYNGFAHLAAGLCCGLSSLASGLSIGIAADSGTRAVGAQSAMAASWKKMGFTGDAGGQPTSSGDALFVGTVLIQVFAGNLGLYGLISALILSQMDYACESGN